MRRADILLGFPVYGRHVDVGIFELVAEMQNRSRHILTVTVEQGPYITSGRNRIIERLITSDDHEWVYFWDTDCVPETTKFLDLLLETAEDFNARMVGGIYPLKNMSGQTVVFQERAMMTPGPKAIQAIEQDGLQHRDHRLVDGTIYGPVQVRLDELTEPSPVWSLGGGSMLVHRDVFAKVDAPWFAMPQYADGEESEDVNFSKKVRAAGFELYADPRFRIRHYGHYGFGSSDIGS